MTMQTENAYPLNQLYFYLTEGCNLACRHCWLAPKFDPNGDRYAILSVEHFETAIREAKPLGLKNVKLTGGEPLLHPQITQLLEIVRHEGLGLTIETNGVLLTEELAAEIASFPRRFVSVSLDGADAATHEWVRGVPGSFEDACRGVRLLAKAGVGPQVIFSIMRHNAHQVEAIVRLAEELGATSLKFNVVQPTERGEKLHASEETLDIAQLIELGRYVDKDLAPTTRVHLYFSYPPAFQSLRRISNDDCKGVCGILGILGVIPSGHYALCGIGENVPELVFGVVGDNRLEDVWLGNETLLTLRDGLPGRLQGVCSVCLMKYHCLGMCIAQNYYRTKDLWAPFWFCEAAEGAGLFPASRLALRS